MFYLQAYQPSTNTYHKNMLYMFYTLQQAKCEYRQDFKLSNKKLIWSVVKC